MPVHRARTSPGAAALAVAIIVAGWLGIPAAVLADTCCANAPVTLSPRAASPGDTVTLQQLVCLAADNSGPVPFEPRSFWLLEGARAADDAPDTTPGEGAPADLPDTAGWHPLEDVTPAGDGTGSATLTVPDLPAGRYQLWWWCDGHGPGGGIHYSTGSSLTVQGTPDTATGGPDAAGRDGGVTAVPIAVLLGAAGAGAWVATWRRTRRSADTARSRRS